MKYVIYAQQIDENHYALVNAEGELVDEQGEFTHHIVVKEGRAADSGYLIYAT